MKRMIKCISVLLSILLFTVTLYACKGETVDIHHTADLDQGIDKTSIINYIVSDGTSPYTIVIPEDADACILYAAQELCDFIDKSTGVKLPIKKDNTQPLTLKGNIISLGATSFLEVSGIKVDYNSLNYDGFSMKTVGNNLFISGYRSSGVLYGVYDFLERFVGIRFLTEECTYLPNLESLHLYKTDRIEVPAFYGRDYLAQQSMMNKGFASRLKMNSSFGSTADMRFGEGGVNSYYTNDSHSVETILLPFETYGGQHPDWYADANGSEICYTNGLTSEGKVDFDNKDGLAYNMLERCKEFVIEKPYGRYLMIGQEDNNIWCSCANCQSSDATNGGKSGTLMVFINAIAEAIEDWQKVENIERDITVVTFAYYKTIDPPVKQVEGKFVPANEKVVARPNVAVKMAWMGCFSHPLTSSECAENKIFHQRFENWRMVANRLTVWDYSTNYDFHFFWFDIYSAIAENYKYYQSIGVEAILTQGAPHVSNYYQGHLNNYIVAKLLWNPNIDVNMLVKEFNQYYYGDSAAAINDFYNLMRVHTETLDETYANGFHNELYTSKGFKDFEHYPISFLEEACKIISDEIEVVQSSTRSAEDKLVLEKKLLQAYIQPQSMVLYNYDAYYDPQNKNEYAIEFFKNIETLGIKYYAEGQSIANLKAQYGVA